MFSVICSGERHFYGKTKKILKHKYYFFKFGDEIAVQSLFFYFSDLLTSVRPVSWCDNE